MISKALTSPQVPGFICVAISTGLDKEPSIATPILSFTFSRETNRDLSKPGTSWVRKVRGITLNYSTKQLVNFDVIRDMVLGTSAEPTLTVHTEMQIKPKRKGEGGTAAIVRISFFKRRSLAENSSVSFGYK